MGPGRARSPARSPSPSRRRPRTSGSTWSWATYERGPERGTVHNTAALIGPTGDVLGIYRKTHLFYLEDREAGGWVTRGDHVLVVDTDLARIGLLICFDGDFPELARVEAVLGAEVVCRPSAFLRSADIWELTTRARAYDNHVYVVAANAVGVRPGRDALLRQLADRHPGGRGAGPGRHPAGLVQRPPRPGHRHGHDQPRLQRPPALRPPGRPQPGPLPAPPGRPAPPRHGPASRTRRPSDDRPADPGRGRHRRHVHRRGRARRGHRRAGHHQDPLDAGRPGRGLPDRGGQGPGRRRRGAEAVAAVFHGTTVATNALLQGEVGRLGFLTTAGFRHLLEIARQSVPDGYGNSYFWVKPDRIVPATWSGGGRAARRHRRRAAPARRGRGPGRPPGSCATGR